ncbi:MAG: hypothetical protein ACYCW6_12000 [Candidatus Xenobia bacterium]
MDYNEQPRQEELDDWHAAALSRLREISWALNRYVAQEVWSLVNQHSEKVKVAEQPGIKERGPGPAEASSILPPATSGDTLH